MIDLFPWGRWPTPDEWQAFGAMATAVIALAAAIIALRQYRTAVRNQIEQARPFIHVDFFFLGAIVACIEVKNTGLTAAHNVTFAWDQKPEAQDDHTQAVIDRALFDGSIPFLAPGRSILYRLNRYDGNEPADLPRRFEVTAQYYGHEKTKWESGNVLDIDQWADTIVERDPYESIARELKKLADAAQNQKDAEQTLAKAADSVNVFLENSPRVVAARAKQMEEWERRRRVNETRAANRKVRIVAQEKSNTPSGLTEDLS